MPRVSLLLLVGVLAAHLVGVGVFLAGFLPTRHVLGNVTTLAPATPPARAVVVLVDALRYDFAVCVWAGWRGAFFPAH